MNKKFSRKRNLTSTVIIIQTTEIKKKTNTNIKKAFSLQAQDIVDELLAAKEGRPKLFQRYV